MRARRQPAQAQPGDVMKFAMPRNHLHVTHEGVVIQPGLVLGSGAAFQANGGRGHGGSCSHRRRSSASDVKTAGGGIRAVPITTI
jgi:hypothetical protein